MFRSALGGDQDEDEEIVDCPVEWPPIHGTEVRLGQGVGRREFKVHCSQRTGCSKVWAEIAVQERDMDIMICGDVFCKQGKTTANNH